MKPIIKRFVTRIRLYREYSVYCPDGFRLPGFAWPKAKVPIGVQKPGSQYSPAIYTMDIAYKIDIPLFIFDRYITGI